MRYFIKFSYLGTQYRGMQKNIIKDTNVILRDTDTIQGTLENAFTTLIPQCSTPPKLYCSSRTDVGVHALCNTAHIDLENKYNVPYEPELILKTINQYMMKCHHDIRLLECIPMKPDFHSRRLIKSRTYIYRFMIAKDNVNQMIPIMEKSQCFHLRSHTFDIERLKSATKLFMGTRNFQTFSKKKMHYKPINFVRSLNCLNVEAGQSLMPFDTLSQNFNFWNIVCSSQSFLYNQVRKITAALLAVATGIITERDITIMLQVPGHHNWNPRVKVVPGNGLYLTNIEHHPEFDEYKLPYKKSPNSDIIIPEGEYGVVPSDVDENEDEA